MTITLQHDDNGNLRFDGLYNCTYDFLNRLVKVSYGADAQRSTLTLAPPHARRIPDRIARLAACITDTRGPPETANHPGIR